MLCLHHSCRSVTSAGRQQRGSQQAQSARPILSRDTRNAALSASSALFSKEMFLLTCRATFKLAIGCAGIMLLMKSGRIPSTAPQVLSKLAFNVTIPSMLFVKSAETLASSQGDPRYLLVPLIAAVEVAIGFVLGGIAAAWAVRPAPPKPTKAEAAIAASVAGSVGSPALAASLYPERTSAPAGMKAVVQTACAFGNALTMPLLFMLSLFPASVASVATGAVALFLLGWSPMFWTLGHSRINGAADAILAETTAQDTTQPSTKPSSSSSSSRYGAHSTL